MATPKIKEIKVNLQSGSYSVFCGAGAATAERIRKYLTPGINAVVSSKKVWEQHGRKNMTWANHEIILPDGEEYKTFSQVENIINELADIGSFGVGMRRDGTVIAFGGGVVGDVAGFAAAIYMRGIRLIQIPTTLLAQVDAAIGGKTGVNHKSRKNMIGAFYQPAAVFCDTDFLKTLPEREYLSGFAEVVKYALLGDAEFFSWLEKNAAALMARENTAMQKAIVKSVQMKAKIVAEDEREISGKRALLNLGHTFAHAVENVTGYGEWLHGEAVAAGLVAAAKLSEKMAKKKLIEKGLGFSANDTNRIAALLKKFNLPVSFSGVNLEKIYEVMGRDKKFTTSEVRFVLMNAIGEAEFDSLYNAQGTIRKVLEEMQ